MILHLFHDEKFIDGAIDTFEKVYPNGNKYIVLSYDSHLKYIKKHINKVLIAPYKSHKYLEYIDNISEYEAVVIHYLDDQKLKIIKDAPNGVRFVWNSWGADIYNRLPVWRYKLYGKRTNSLVTRSVCGKILNFNLNNSLLLRLLQNIRAEIKLHFNKNIIKKISYYSTVIPPEKNFIIKHYKIRGIYVPFNYGSSLLNSENYINFINKQANNILLGNSAAPTNNHLEILDLLSMHELNKRKVITPLSYGATSPYIDSIKKYAQKVIGNNFLPLDSILDPTEYFNVISSCSVCIMNHYRQNGMGNITFMLWIGTKVFISERNPTYSYLIGIGITVYSIEKELTNSLNKNIFEDLPDHIRASNRKIIEEQFGYDIILKRIENFIKVITVKDTLKKG